MAFDDINPFNLGNWENAPDVGATDTGDDIEAGNRNFAFPNDATIISVAAADNAALIASNTDGSHGSVGVFGRTFAATDGIGIGRMLR